MLQPPSAALMHGFRGFGLALARSARRTGQVGSQPKSKNDTVTRGTAVAISGGVCVFYQILLTLCNQSPRKNEPCRHAITPVCDYSADEIQTAAQSAAHGAGRPDYLPVFLTITPRRVFRLTG